MADAPDAPEQLSRDEHIAMGHAYFGAGAANNSAGAAHFQAAAQMVPGDDPGPADAGGGDTGAPDTPAAIPGGTFPGSAQARTGFPRGSLNARTAAAARGRR